MEYPGYHPYIDGRAEVFTSANNGGFDYSEEYYDLILAGTYYRDFVDKYDFDYLIVSKGTDRYLYTSMSRDDDFEQIYTSDDVVLFKRK